MAIMIRNVVWTISCALTPTTSCQKMSSIYHTDAGNRVDVLLEPGTAQSMGVDLAVTHPVSRILTPIEAAIPGLMAEKMAKMKKDHYTNLCAQPSITFVAGAIETGGRICGDFRNYLEKLFSLISP